MEDMIENDESQDHELQEKSLSPSQAVLLSEKEQLMKAALKEEAEAAE